MDWHYMEEGRQVGPVSESQMQALVAAGTVKADTLVWREGMASWQAFGKAGSGPAAVAAGRQACSQCGRALAVEEMARFGDRWVCAACKPIYVQRLKEGVGPATQMVYGGFWIRFAARLIDGIILSVVNFIISVPLKVQAAAARGQFSSGLLVAQLYLILIGMAIGIAYETLFVGKYAATPGKMVCSLKVVRPDGSALTYGQAFGRYLGTFVSTLTLGIGYLIAAFDEEKRALHDRICGTRVVKV